MSKEAKKSVKRVTTNSCLNREPILQPQLQLKLIHLQTVLMLAQLNSTYYQLSRSILKATEKVEQSYFRIKMQAFLSIQNFGYNLIHIRSQAASFQLAQNRSRFNCIQNKIQQTKIEEYLPQFTKKTDSRQIQAFVLIKLQFKMSGLQKLYYTKMKSLVSHAFYSLISYCDTSNNQINSSKSSKIETNDSQKGKPFRRSAQKTTSKKSFSLEKSEVSKHQRFVPIKYQTSKLNTRLNTNSQQKAPKEDPYIASLLNRFISNPTKGTERRNTLQISRNKKQIKYSSTKKYNTNLATQQRQSKIIQLEYLRKKYQRLMGQFTQFSQRFLRVIEQEQNLQ